MGENLDFNFSISKPQEDRLAMFGCTRMRRQPKRDNTIIKIEGEYNRVISGSELFRVNTQTHRIVPKSEYDALPVNSKAKKKKPTVNTHLEEPGEHH